MSCFAFEYFFIGGSRGVFLLCHRSIYTGRRKAGEARTTRERSPVNGAAFPWVTRSLERSLEGGGTIRVSIATCRWVCCGERPGCIGRKGTGGGCTHGLACHT
ncbi:unnamed protein product [Sphacelaria rigidula]